jgi:hypothetical protein
MAGGDDMRFSDDQLTQLRADFDDHVTKEEAMWKKLIEHQDANAKAIKDLTSAIKAQTDATAPIVQMHSDLMGAARLGHRVTELVIWLIKAGGVLAGVGYAIHWIVQHAPKH